jgi:hypothetical protein
VSAGSQNGEATSTKEKSSEKETPVDRILELHRGGCVDGWTAHFSAFGMTAKAYKLFCRKLKSASEPATPHQVSYNVGYIHSIITARLPCKKIENTIRPDEKSRTPFVQMITHCAMGAILGALLALALMVANRHIFHFIASSSTPLTEMAFLVGFISFVFAMGATLSGFIFRPSN